MMPFVLGATFSNVTAGTISDYLAAPAAGSCANTQDGDVDTGTTWVAGNSYFACEGSCGNPATPNRGCIYYYGSNYTFRTWAIDMDISAAQTVCIEKILIETTFDNSTWNYCYTYNNSCSGSTGIVWQLPAVDISACSGNALRWEIKNGDTAYPRLTEIGVNATTYYAGTVTTNLTTDSVIYPTLNIDVQVNETGFSNANCTVLTNVSWINCNISTGISDVASVGCNWTENGSNVANVEFYGQCNESGSSIDSVIKPIKYIDSSIHPNISMNLSNITNYDLVYNLFTITGYNWTQNGTCGILTDSADYTCINNQSNWNGTLASHTTNVYCKPNSNFDNKTINMYVNCNTTNYLNYNSTIYSIWVDSDIGTKIVPSNCSGDVRVGSEAYNCTNTYDGNQTNGNYWQGDDFAVQNQSYAIFDLASEAMNITRIAILANWDVDETTCPDNFTIESSFENSSIMNYTACGYFTSQCDITNPNTFIWHYYNLSNCTGRYIKFNITNVSYYPNPAPYSVRINEINYTGYNYTLNSSPEVNNISIQTEGVTVFGNKDLGCNATIYDVDNDSVNLTVTWFQNISGSITQNTSYDCAVNNIVDTVNNYSFRTTTACGNFTGQKYVNDSFLCMIGVRDELNNFAYTNTTWQFIDYTSDSPTLASNLSTASWVYPSTSGMTWNVSFSLFWNESATCSIIDNVSWVSCDVQTIDLTGGNSTLITCSASELNQNSVQMYAQCNSTSWTNINSPAIVMHVEASSNPTLWTNLSDYNDYLLTGHQFTSIGVNYTEAPLSCELIINQSGLTCGSGTIGLLANSSYEINYSCTPDYVQEIEYEAYAQCNGTLYNLVNSTTYTFLVDANSNASIGTNISDYNDYSLSGHQFTATGINYLEAPLSCEMILNDTGLTCGSGTIGLLANTSYEINFTCTPDYVQIDTYSAYVQCNGTLYNHINSSGYNFTVNANSNPAIEANFTDIDHVLTYDIRVNGSNITETYTCGMIFNSSNNECDSFSLKSPTYENVTSCTELVTENDWVSVYVNCNGTLYTNINSTTYSIIHDTADPNITITLPNTTSWNYDNQITQFDFTCEHLGVVNLTYAALTCYNQSGAIIYNNASYTGDVNTYNMLVNQTFDADELLCYFDCTDNLTTVTTSTRNVTIINLNATNTNLTDLNQTDRNFFINLSYNFNGDNATCALVPNDTSAVSCVRYTGQSPALFNCSVGVNAEANVSAVFQCNDTARSYIQATTADSVDFVVDVIDPSITAINWTANKTFYFQNISGQFRFRDNLSIFRWNVTIDGEEIDSALSPSYTDYYYNLSVLASDYKTGKHYLVINVSDGHTGKTIDDYKVKKGSWFDDSYLEFETRSNKIKISLSESKSKDKFKTEKKKDRYTFSVTPDIKDKKNKRDDVYEVGGYTKMMFKLEFEQPSYIISKPNSPYVKWVVSGNNWVDLYSDNANNKMVNYYYDLSTADPYDIIAEVYTNVGRGQEIEFQSIGDLNTVVYNTTFYVVNMTAYYSDPVADSSNTTMNLSANITGTPAVFSNFTAVLWYNGTTYTPTKSSDVDSVDWTDEVVVPTLSSTQAVEFYWNITPTGEPTFQWNLSHTAYYIAIGTNCSETGYIQAMQICGYNETNITENISDMRLNLNLEVLFNDMPIKEFGFEFDNATCYDICITPNDSSMQVNAKMEFGDGIYTDRKYYLTDYTLNNESETLKLYHLLDSLASDIVLTVYDTATGKRLENAIIKILRYYPQLDNDTGTAGYYTVEVEKTDLNGETVGKMVLTDVWYKFIVEYPAGTIYLNTNIEKIVSLDKPLGLDLSTNPMLEYKTVAKMQGFVKCTKSTGICSFTWNDPTGMATRGELKIYKDNGWYRQLYYNESAESSAATIVYTIANTSGYNWVAEGWVYVDN